MSRRGQPTAEDIVRLARRKTEEFANQRALDNRMIETYAQTNFMSLYSPKGNGKDVKGKDGVRPVGSGMMGFLVDQDVWTLSGRPFARILPLGGADAERHVSQKLEPWANTAVWLGTYGVKVWDRKKQDLRLVGRAWSKVFAAPQFWSDDRLAELVAELNRLVEADADAGQIQDQRDRIAAYKRDNPAIAWLYVSPRATWPEYDERGMSEVVEMRKMGRGEVEALMDLPDDLKKSERTREIDVIEWANEEFVATVLPGEGGLLGTPFGRREPRFLKEPWEHGEGVNPYVFIEGDPMPDNDEGWRWRGAGFHMRELLPSVDEVMSDMRTAFHQEAVTPPVVTTNLEQRAALGIEEKEIKVEPGKTVQLYTGQGWREEAGRFPTQTVNPDMLRYVSLASNFADRGGLYRPALTGAIQSSGQSAVSLDTAKQIGVGELAVAREALEQGFADVVSRFLRAVPVLSRNFPEAMEKVVVRVEDKEHGSREIAVTPKDTRGYENLVRGKVALNLPVNEGQNVTNARLATDPQHPLLSDISALQRYFDHENPMEETDAIAEQTLSQGLTQLLLATLQRRAALAVEGTGDLGGIVERAGSIPQAAQQALAQSFGQNVPPGLMEQLARSQANVARTGRGQRMSQLGLSE